MSTSTLRLFSVNHFSIEASTACTGRGTGAVWARTNKGNERPLNEGNREGGNGGGNLAGRLSMPPEGKQS